LTPRLEFSFDPALNGGIFMCEGVALVISEGSEKTVMEEVVSVSVRGDRITLLNEDGDSLEFLGVKEVLIDLVRHRVTIILG